MLLTALEIKQLAGFAGFTIAHSPDNLDTEFAVDSYPNTKVSDDDGMVKYYSHIAYLNEYPDEGVYPLGNEMLAPKDT